MSKFVTAITVDVEAVRKLLPENAYVERVLWNGREQQLEIFWDHPPFHTGRDFAIDFPASDLKAKKLAKGVAKKKAPGPIMKADNKGTAQTPGQSVKAEAE